MKCEHVKCETFRHKLSFCLTRFGLPEIHKRPPARRAFPVVGPRLWVPATSVSLPSCLPRELPGFRQ